MNKIDWVQKLGSRKFWATLIACIGAVAAAFGLGEGSVEQITSIIGAFATLIVYILVEGNIDAHRAEAETLWMEGEPWELSGEDETEESCLLEKSDW